MQKSLVVFAAVAGVAYGQDPKNYNAFIQGDFTCSNSDTEGRLAVGGVATLTNYNVNCMTYADPSKHECIQMGSVLCTSIQNDDPALIGRSITATQGELSAGVVAYGDSFTSTRFTKDINCPAIHNAAYPNNVQAAFTSLASTSDSYATYTPTGTTSSVNYGGRYQITVSTLERYAIFSVDGDQLNSCSQFTVSVPSNVKVVLINVSGTSVKLTNFQIFGADSVRQKIMWNFPQATTLELLNFSPEGSILAPRADLIATNGHVNGQVYAKSFTSRGDMGVCTQLNWYPFTGTFPNNPPSPPASTCGDNIVQVGEDCDGGVCCSSTCTFLTTSTTCRASAGECDVPETCSGVSSSCPADAFKPETTPCGSPFGICDVQMEEHCPGNAATCRTAPAAFSHQWDAFNVISFDEYHVSGGDVEGRLAVKNFLNVSGFTVGLKTLPTDAFSYVDLLVAGDAIFTDGSVNNGPGNNNGAISVGGTFTAPAYLESLLSNVVAFPSAFDDLQTYYNTVGAKIASLGPNAQASLIYGDGLSLTCNNADSAMYIVQVPVSMFNKVNWYITSGCKLTAAWLITLTGSDDITIKGSPFPGIVERVVYNIQGTQTIFAQNGVAANILAPNAAFQQSQGVTYGKVIVRTVNEARQNNKPECLNFANIVITQKNLVAVQAGDNFIYVYDLTPYIPGDLICNNGNCQKIVGGRQDDNGSALILDGPFPANVAALSTFTTEVDSPSDQSRSATLPIEQGSGASALVASVVLASVAALLL